MCDYVQKLWGRGVLRTIQEELLELIIVKYAVLFLHFYNWLWTLFCSCLYFKMTLFVFLQTKSLCIFLEETRKEKKAASRWSSGKRGGKQGKCWQELPFSSRLTANPKFFLFQRALWACTTLSHGPELVTLQKWGENTCRITSFILVLMPYSSVLLLVESISLLIVLMSTESDLKTATLEKYSCACLGDVCE